MKSSDRVKDVQKHLIENKIDGWLLYDFHKINDLAISFLDIPEDRLLSRRFFYWIPAKGEPIKIMHIIEPYALDHLPGESKIYLKWQELEECLKETLKGAKVVAMEYSPRGAIPYVSKVDGGIIDLVRECGVKVVSSAPFLQYYTCVWDSDQLESHLAAADVLDKTAEKAWQFIASALKNEKFITEYDVQQMMLQEIEKNGCVTSSPPFCCVNAHSADPHYAPQKENSSPIKKGDFILIDLWCKKKGPRSTFADITRVGVAASAPTERQNEIFQIVRSAQKAATEYVQNKVAAGEIVKGFEVDLVCRKVIADAGYGKYFTHRTGHNIHTQDHGPGAHIDSLETLDERPLIPRTCFSIEPGIYLPGAFGVRLEYDVYITEKRTIQITGGVQNALKVLF
jgi:Xaa-Pro aminopeptidase